MEGQEAGPGAVSCCYLGEKMEEPPGAAMPWARLGNGPSLGAGEMLVCSVLRPCGLAQAL